MAAAGRTLFCLAPSSKPRYLLTVESSTILGRGGDSTFVFNDKRISKQHCRLRTKDTATGKAYLEVSDTSSNGTFLNGKKIGNGNIAKAQGNDVIQLVPSTAANVLAFKVIECNTEKSQRELLLRQFKDIISNVKSEGSFAAKEVITMGYLEDVSKRAMARYVETDAEVAKALCFLISTICKAGGDVGVLDVRQMVLGCMQAHDEEGVQEHGVKALNAIRGESADENRLQPPKFGHHTKSKSASAGVSQSSLTVARSTTSTQVTAGHKQNSNMGGTKATGQVETKRRSQMDGNRSAQAEKRRSSYGTKSAQKVEQQPNTKPFKLTPLLSRKSAKEQKKEFQELLNILARNDPSVNRIVARGCKLSYKRVKKLVDALKINTVVWKLDLANGGVASEDCLVPLAKGLRENTSMRHLIIYDNLISMPTAQRFQDLCRDAPNIIKLEAYSDKLAIRHHSKSEIGKFIATTNTYCAQNQAFQNLQRGQSNEPLDLSMRHMKELNPRLLLPSVRSFSLAENSISSLPYEFGTLTRLRELNLSDNEFSKFPNILCSLTELKQVDLSHNHISELPDGVREMTGLQTLILHHNKFTSVPNVLLALPLFRELDITKNRIKGIPKEILNQKGKAPLLYLHQLQLGSQTTFRMKLMLVGAGNVGKTSLLKSIDRFCHKVKVRQDEAPNVATDGIDITEIYIKNKALPSAEDRIHFSAWDFAGQEVYYATHNFFLSHRAIYLVVFNAANPDLKSVEYWVQSVTRMKAPVCLVASHADELEEDDLTTAIRPMLQKFGKTFTSLQNVVALSNKTGAGIPELLDILVATCLKEPYMPEQMPKPYIRLEAKLKETSVYQKHCDFDTYLLIARECGLDSVEGARAAAIFMNDIGVISYFPDLDEDFLILSPQWLTDMFATVCTLKHNFVKNGILMRSECFQIWQEPDYPENLHNILIAILRKFKLAEILPPVGDKSRQLGDNSLVSESSSRIFIPALLSSEEDSRAFKNLWSRVVAPESVVGRFFHFKFIPIGFFARIIVHILHSFSWYPEYYWINGVVCTQDDSKLLIRLEGYYLKILVRGQQPEKYIGDIVESVDTVCSELLQQSYSVLVPCVQCLFAEEDDPHLFTVVEITQAISEGKKFVRCGKITRTVLSLASLAPDMAMTDFQNMTVKYDELEEMKKIGRGSYAVVYKAKLNGLSVAVKELVMKGDQAKKAEIFDEFRREANIMQRLQHPNVVSLQAICTDPFCMVVDFMDLGSLYDVVHDKSLSFDWNLRVCLALDCIKGMEFLHSVGIVHRDLKTPNVLVKRDIINSCGAIAKIADFGLSRVLSLSNELRRKAVVNPIWLPPEVLKKESYNEKVDEYAMGVMMYEMWVRKDFFYEMSFASEIEDAVVQGRRPDLPVVGDSHYIGVYRNVLRGFWSQSADARPSFLESLSMFAAVDMDSIPRDPASKASFVAVKKKTAQTSKAGMDTQELGRVASMNRQADGFKGNEVRLSVIGLRSRGLESQEVSTKKVDVAVVKLEEGCTALVLDGSNASDSSALNIGDLVEVKQVDGESAWVIPTTTKGKVRIRLPLGDLKAVFAASTNMGEDAIVDEELHDSVDVAEFEGGDVKLDDLDLSSDGDSDDSDDGSKSDKESSACKDEIKSAGKDARRESGAQQEDADRSVAAAAAAEGVTGDSRGVEGSRRVEPPRDVEGSSRAEGSQGWTKSRSKARLSVQLGGARTMQQPVPSQRASGGWSSASLGSRRTSQRNLLSRVQGTAGSGQASKDGGAVQEEGGGSKEAARAESTGASRVAEGSPSPGAGIEEAGTYLVAMVDYDNQGKNNVLSLKKGDVVRVEKEGDKWWVGVLNGVKGYVPSPDAAPYLKRK